MKKLLFIVLVPAILTGCASNKIHTFGKIDADQKSITVPTGSSGLKGEIKSYLNNNGWELVVYQGAEVTEGSMEEDSKTKTYDTFNSRYNLKMSWDHYDYCMTFQPLVWYEISIIDNKAGEEVLAMSGKGCEKNIVKKFAKQLEGITR